MEQAFKRDIQSLDTIFEFLDACCSTHKLNESLVFNLKFAVEEIFTNMVKYNPAGPDDIAINFNVDAEKAVVQLIDSESVPFDLTRTADVDLESPIAQRKPGGLGIHLVKNMVDKVDYEHINNCSTVTLTMKLDK